MTFPGILIGADPCQSSLMSFASLLAGYANRSAASSGNNGSHQTKHEKEQQRSQIVGPHYQRIQEVANEFTHNVSTVNTSEQLPFGGLGILIIIVDSLPHEILWRLWLDHYIHHHSPQTVPSQTTSSSISTTSPATYQHESPPVQIWIHAKHPERVTSAWVQQRLVTGFQMRPSWGSIELTEVMVHMLVSKEISLFLLFLLYPLLYVCPPYSNVLISPILVLGRSYGVCSSSDEILLCL